VISKANVEHSDVSAALLRSVGQIREIADRNAVGVKQTRGGTEDLLRRTEALMAIVRRPSGQRPSDRAARSNGRARRSSR